MAIDIGIPAEPRTKTDCGCPCTETAVKQAFTYIRWATDINGSNFSALRNTEGLSRCYQAIITTAAPMDETSLSFQSMFIGKWFNVCEPQVPAVIPKAFQVLPLQSISMERVGFYSWNYYLGYNAKIVLDIDAKIFNYQLEILNASNGDYGTLIIDGTQTKGGTYYMAVPQNSRVIMGNRRFAFVDIVAQNNAVLQQQAVQQAAAKVSYIPLSPQSIDIWTWVFDGTTFYWTYGQFYEPLSNGGVIPIVKA